MQRMVLALKKLKGLNNILPTFDLPDKVEFVGRTAFTETFLREAENVDFTDEFHVRRRDGFDKKVNGNIHSLWSDGSICLYREGVYLKRLYQNYTSSILRSDLSSLTIPMFFLSDKMGKVYYSDEFNTGIVDNGISRSWGLDYPPHPTVTRIDGAMRDGNYKITLVYVRENGMISGSEVPIMASVAANSAFLLTGIVASTDSTVKYIDIYVTYPNGDALYFFNRITNGTTNYTISSNTVNSGLPLNVVKLSKPPTGDMLEYYNGRIYVIKNNMAWYSEPFAYELFKLRSNYITFESPFTLFNSVKDGIWVSDGNNTYFLQGDNPPFIRFDITEYGAIKGTARVYDGEIGTAKGKKVIVWSSPRGICVGGDGGSFTNLTEGHYEFPIAGIGSGLIRRKRGITQFITSLKNSSNPENIYE